VIVNSNISTLLYSGKTEIPQIQKSRYAESPIGGIVDKVITNCYSALHCARHPGGLDFTLQVVTQSASKKQGGFLEWQLAAVLGSNYSISNMTHMIFKNY